MADITVSAGLACGDTAGVPIDRSLMARSGWRALIADSDSVRNQGGQAFVPEELRRLAF